MSTNVELAIELSERNGKCGALDYRLKTRLICLKNKDHPGEHRFEDVDRVIPFDTNWRTNRHV